MRTRSRIFTCANCAETKMDILELIVKDKSDKEIAEILSISPRTVHFHVHELLRLLGVRSRVGLVIYALQRGYLQMPKIEKRETAIDFVEEYLAAQPTGVAPESIYSAAKGRFADLEIENAILAGKRLQTVYIGRQFLKPGPNNRFLKNRVDN